MEISKLKKSKRLEIIIELEIFLINLELRLMHLQEIDYKDELQLILINHTISMIVFYEKSINKLKQIK